MAKQQQSAEPKAPLIVALAFFVLATLVLGVLYYLETDKSASAVAEAKKATDDKGNADKLRGEEQDKVRLYKVAMGVNTAAEAEELKNTRNDAKVKAEYDAMLAALRANLKGLTDARASLAGVGTGQRLNPQLTDILQWTAMDAGKPDKTPELSAADAVVSAIARQLLAAGQTLTAEKSLEAARASFTARAAEADATKKNLEATIEAVKKQAQDDIAKRDKELADIRGKFNARTDEYAKATTTMTEEATRSNILLEESRNKANNLQKQNDQYTEKAESAEDPFRYAKPLGKIVRRERGTDTVYIDLGSADRVTVGLRFTVQPANTPEVGTAGRLRPRTGPTGRPVLENGQPVYDMVPKGRIEVIEVYPNQARCRITSETDLVRDRVEVGDLLYNASWRRGQTDTIALYGVFDVNGDGTDDTRQVIGDLQKMGIRVAAYFDLEQRKWLDPTTGRPTAVTEQVVYAIEGTYPAPTTGDSLSAARGELRSALDDAKKQARDRGVKVVKARNYFPRVGYDYRGGDVAEDRINQAYNRYLRTAPPAEGQTPAPNEGK